MKKRQPLMEDYPPSKKIKISKVEYLGNYQLDINEMLFGGKWAWTGINEYSRMKWRCPTLKEAGYKYFPNKWKLFADGNFKEINSSEKYTHKLFYSWVERL
jgi:hypothetical protein